MMWSKRRKPHVSMVVATYNVAAYIEAFFDSIIAQTDGLEALEVIIVNDGSTDQSGEIAQRWATQYPQIFFYIEQENQGVAAARNVGLTRATGTWICFPDPDDFLSPDYLAEMRAEIRRPRLRKLLAVAAPLVFYHEDTDQPSDTHPLRKRFGTKVRRHDSTDMDHVLLPHTSSTFMRRADILAHGLTFDARIQPSFEDAHFIIRLLLCCPGRAVSFIPKPVYYYRKRATKNSLVDGVVSDKRWYGPHLESAYLSLLREAQRVRGHVPKFVQNNVLFSLLAKLRYLTGPRYASNTLSGSDQHVFSEKLAEVMGYIEIETLRTSRLTGFYRIHRLALLALFKDVPPSLPHIEMRICDKNPNTYFVRWVSGGESDPEVVVKVSGVALPDGAQEVERRMLFDRTYCRVFLQKVSLKQGQRLQVLSQGHPLAIHHGKTDLGTDVTDTQLAALPR